MSGAGYTRRSRRLAYLWGLDLAGLDKRQQRRLVRRAAGLWVRCVETLAAEPPQWPRLSARTIALVDEAWEVNAFNVDRLRELLHIVDVDVPTGLCLDSASLFSKTGFNAGTEPEQWLEYCDAMQVRYPTHHEWNRVLARLVWRRLLPALPAHVEVDLHDVRQTNPVRVLRVDGRPVTWSGDSAAGHYFDETTVWVPWSDVANELDSIR